MKEPTMNMTACRHLAAVTTLAVITCLAGPAVAQPADDFFRGKQISIIVGSTAGGGYDAYGRLLARHIGRHIPGNPTVVAKNMPGAGGLALANYLYNRAPKDGTEIGTVAERPAVREAVPHAVAGRQGTRCSTRRNSAGSAA